MKTHILRLDPHDDVISTKDKMGWSKAGRILIVWPERKRVLDRPLDLVLIRRHSRALGAQLAIICPNRQIAKNARELGIPTFKNLRQAQRHPWRVARSLRVRRRRPRRRKLTDLEELERLRAQAHPQDPTWMRNPVVRLVAFLIGILAVLSIAAAIVPTAEVHLAPESRSQSANMDITAEQGISQVSLTGRIPLYTTSIVVEGRDAITTTGQTNVPSGFATGRVTFTNVTSDTLDIPAETIIRTLDTPIVRFETTRAITLPAGAGISASTQVRALLAGSEANLPAESLVAIEGPLGLQATARNTLPTSGGSDIVKAAPSQKDHQNLFEVLSADLGRTAMDEMGELLAPGDIIFASSLTTTQVLAESFTPAEIEPSDTLTLQLRLEMQANYVQASDLQQLAISALDAILPDGFLPIEDSQDIQRLSSPRMISEGRASWRMRAERDLQASIAPDEVSVMLLGRPISEARHNLEVNLPLDAYPTIQLYPQWWPRMPLLPFRIGTVFDESIGR